MSIMMAMNNKTNTLMKTIALMALQATDHFILRFACSLLPASAWDLAWVCVCVCASVHACMRARVHVCVLYIYTYSVYARCSMNDR